MRAIHAVLLAAVLAAGCNRDAPSTPQQPSASSTEQVDRETARLNEWLDARYEEQLDFSPLTKTQLGRKDDYDRIDDLSEAGARAQLEWLRGDGSRARARLRPQLLTPEGADFVRPVALRARARGGARGRFAGAATCSIRCKGAHTFLPQALINFHRVDEEADMVAYVARIGEVGRALGEALERAQLAAGEGVHAPRFAYDAVIAAVACADHRRAVRRRWRFAALCGRQHEDRGAGGRRQDRRRRAPTSCEPRQRRR